MRTERTSAGVQRQVPRYPAPHRSKRRGGSTRTGRSAAILEQIERPEVTLVHWRRTLRAIDHPLPVLGWERTLRGDERTPFEPALAPFADAGVRTRLQDDCTRLLASFRQLTGARAVVAGLAVIDGDQCRRFHADYVRLRLLCTYVGPGTEWIAEEDVVTAERESEEDFTLHNHKILRSGGVIERASTGDVVLMKGQSWPGNAGRGAIHRSPPIEADGLRRLVFRLTLP